MCVCVCFFFLLQLGSGCPVLRRLRQEDFEFEADLKYIVPHLRKPSLQVYFLNRVEQKSGRWLILGKR